MMVAAARLLEDDPDGDSGSIAYLEAATAPDRGAAAPARGRRGEQARRRTASNPIGGDETESRRRNNESQQWRHEENEVKTAAQQSGIDQNEDRSGKKWVASATCRSTGEERKNLTLICGSRYHVMNSTCIHLRAKGPNIYMYRRRRIYKEPPGEIQ
jgi:hypothetical protein